MTLRVAYRKNARQRTPGGGIIVLPEVIVESEPMQDGMALFFAHQCQSWRILLNLLDENGTKLSLEEATRRSMGQSATD